MQRDIDSYLTRGPYQKKQSSHNRGQQQKKYSDEEEEESQYRNKDNYRGYQPKHEQKSYYEKYSDDEQEYRNNYRGYQQKSQYEKRTPYVQKQPESQQYNNQEKTSQDYYKKPYNIQNDLDDYYKYDTYSQDEYSDGIYDEVFEYEINDLEQVSDDDDEDQERAGKLKILVVAEKNSIAAAIAKALGQKIISKKGRANCFYFDADFKSRKARYCVTATNGHLFNRDFPKEYSDWNHVDPGELFNAETVKKPSSIGIIKLLQREAKNCDYLHLWLDNDREGENICFEVEEVCRPFMKKMNEQQIYRAKFSSITETSLQLAHKNLIKPNELESKSVDARQIIDLKVGVAFSRFQSIYFRKNYPQIQNRIITFGPCQTPTLGFCVSRYEEIQNFKPQTYYQINLTIKSSKGPKLKCEWEGERIINEKLAKDIVTKIKSQTHLEVVNLTKSQKTKSKPIGINTVNLLKFASSYMGVGPQQSMHIAEKLYLQGYISYPRTESTAYSKDFDSQSIIQRLSGYQTTDIREYSKKIIYSGIRQPQNGTDVGDHPPITPTVNIPDKISGSEKTMYEYITKMFLASHSSDCVYMNQRVLLRTSNDSFNFSLQGNKVTEYGFTAIADWLSVSEDSFDAEKYISNNKIEIDFVNYKSAQTTPPGHLTESELLALMESHGIGTDASMATHINNIVQRGYVQVSGGGRQLIPTELGIRLVQGYKKIDPQLVAPELRSNIEMKCNLIAQGIDKYKDVVESVIKIFAEKFKLFQSKINEMDKLFGGQNLGTQSVRGKGRGRVGKYRGRNNEQDSGPSQKATEVTMGDFIYAALAQQQISGQDSKQKPKSENKPVKNFKSKKDEELLY